jgi:hypothetical protein
MSGFLIGALEVLAGTFLAWYLAHKLFMLVYRGLSRRLAFAVITFVLAFLIMLVNRLAGNHVTIPFLTVLGFVNTLNGFDANFPIAEKKDFSVAAVSAVAGGIVGWLLYMELCSNSWTCYPLLRPWF